MRKVLFYVMCSLTMTACAANSVLRSVQLDGKSTSTGIHYNLPKGLLKVSVSKDDSTDTLYRVSVQTLYVPDVGHQFVLQYSQNLFSDDQLDIKVDTCGFLANIESTNTNRVKEVTINLVSAVVGKAGGGPPIKIASLLPPIKPKAKIEVGTFIFDPTDDAEIATINRKIPVTLKITKISSLSTSTFSETDKLRLGPAFFYRPLEPYLFNIVSHDAGGDTVDSMEIIYLPNESPILSIDVVRAFLVSKFTKISFENGIPVSLNISKPSEALEMSKIPLDIAKAIITAPSELIQLRINLAGNETKLLEAERDKLKAELELLKKQQELNERKQSEEKVDQ